MLKRRFTSEADQRPAAQGRTMNDGPDCCACCPFWSQPKLFERDSISPENDADSPVPQDNDEEDDRDAEEEEERNVFFSLINAMPTPNIEEGRSVHFSPTLLPPPLPSASVNVDLGPTEELSLEVGNLEYNARDEDPFVGGAFPLQQQHQQNGGSGGGASLVTIAGDAAASSSAVFGGGGPADVASEECDGSCGADDAIEGE